MNMVEKTQYERERERERESFHWKDEHYNIFLNYIDDKSNPLLSHFEIKQLSHFVIIYVACCNKLS